MDPVVALPPGARPWDRGFRVEAADGVGLRAALWQGGDRGLAVLLSGRTEFMEKMALPATALVERGFSVASLDWRGQGLSDRLAEPAHMGHVARFSDYGLDLAALLAAPEVADLGEVRLMFAHSMGGAIGLAAIYRGVISPGAVALSAPMLGVQMSGSMKVAAAVTTGIARVLGRLDRRPPLGDADKPYVFEGFEGNVLTSDREMFAWLESVVRAEARLQIAMPSLRWFDEAETEMGWLGRQGRLSMPALLLKGSEEAVVDREAIAEAATRLGGELVEIAGARHEFFIERAELRDAAWQAVDTFLANHGV